MGSKRLKATVVKGTKGFEVANKDVFAKVSKTNYDLVNESMLNRYSE